MIGQRSGQAPCSVLQIAAGGLVADAMTVLVGEHRVAEPCMAQGMAQQRQLAVIEPLAETLSDSDKERTLQLLRSRSKE